MSNKILSTENIYKYFIVYLTDDFEIMPLYILLPKTSADDNAMMMKLNVCIFGLTMMTYKKNIFIFRIKPAIVCEKSLIGNPSAIKRFCKPN